MGTKHMIQITIRITERKQMNAKQNSIDLYQVQRAWCLTFRWVMSIGFLLRLYARLSHTCRISKRFETTALVKMTKPSLWANALKRIHVCIVYGRPVEVVWCARYMAAVISSVRISVTLIDMSVSQARYRLTCHIRSVSNVDTLAAISLLPLPFCITKISFNRPKIEQTLKWVESFLTVTYDPFSLSSFLFPHTMYIFRIPVLVGVISFSRAKCFILYQTIGCVNRIELLGMFYPCE